MLRRRLSRYTPAALLEALEPRRVLSTNEFITDADGDVFQMYIQGPGSFTIAPQVNGVWEDVQVTGTTSSSSIYFARTQQGPPGSDGVAHFSRIHVEGTINGLLFAAATLTGEGHFDGPPQLEVTGKVREILFGVSIVSAKISIGSSSAATTLTTKRVIGGPGITGVSITSAGAFDRISAYSFEHVTLSARRFGDVVISNLVGPDDEAGHSFELTATDPAASYGVKRLEVHGNLITSNITSAAPIHDLVLESTNSYQVPGPGGLTRVARVAVFTNGRLDLLRTTAGPFAGEIKASSIGTIDIKGTLSAFVGGADEGHVATDRIDLVRATTINNGELLASRLVSLSAGSIISHELRVGLAGSIAVAGDVEDSHLYFAGFVKTVTTLNTLTVGGTMNNSVMRVHGNTNTVSLGGLTDTFMAFGVNDSVTTFDVTPGDFDATGGNVQTFKLKVRPGDPVNFLHSYVFARRFVNLSSTARFDPGNGTAFFGFKFLQAPSTLSLRTINLGTITNTATNTAVDLDFLYQRI